MWVLASLAGMVALVSVLSSEVPALAGSGEVEKRIQLLHPDKSLVLVTLPKSSPLIAMGTSSHGFLELLEVKLQQEQEQPRPLSVNSYLNQGYTYAGLGNHRQAILSYLPALALAPDNPDVLTAVGIAYWHLNELERAAWFLQQAHNYAPEQHDIYVLLSTIHLQLGSSVAGTSPLPLNNTNAPGSFSSPGVLQTVSLSTLQQAGDNAQSAGNFALAQRFYQRAMALDPHNAEVYFRLGNSYMAQQNYLMAIVSYRYSAELDPINPIPYYQLAMALKEHRREGEAEDVLERALELFSFQGNVMGVELVETALHSFKTN
jgi:tetratricopeptide (TPR) repeat protein